MEKLKLVVLLGTKRVGNKSQFVARHIQRVAERTGDWEVIFVDPNDLNLPGDGNDDIAKDPNYTKITKQAEAFFIVTPEYNHSYPGTLKRVIDSELENYIHKPVAVAGVSSGRIAGARAIAALAEVLREVGLTMTFTDVNVGDSYNAYDEETDMPKDEKIEPAIEKALVELKWMALTLKYGRENIASKYHEDK
jgi:NAD(P)H-dependent FMN reductase